MAVHEEGVADGQVQAARVGDGVARGLQPSDLGGGGGPQRTPTARGQHALLTVIVHSLSMLPQHVRRVASVHVVSGTCDERPAHPLKSIQNQINIIERILIKTQPALPLLSTPATRTNKHTKAHEP